MLVSKRILLNKKFDEITSIWQDCELRDWLNNTFIHKAFSEEEKRYIVQVKNSNQDSFEGKSDTIDRVFLLSRLDVFKNNYCFTTDDSRKCINESTNTYKEWWLRACRIYQEKNKYGSYNMVFCVDDQGKESIELRDTLAGVRPAFWFNLTV